MIYQVCSIDHEFKYFDSATSAKKFATSQTHGFGSDICKPSVFVFDCESVELKKNNCIGVYMWTCKRKPNEDYGYAFAKGWWEYIG